jgi:hypothetical protein
MYAGKAAEDGVSGRHRESDVAEQIYRSVTYGLQGRFCERYVKIYHWRYRV